MKRIMLFVAGLMVLACCFNLSATEADVTLEATAAKPTVTIQCNAPTYSTGTVGWGGMQFAIYPTSSVGIMTLQLTVNNVYWFENSFVYSVSGIEFWLDNGGSLSDYLPYA